MSDQLPVRHAALVDDVKRHLGRFLVISPVLGEARQVHDRVADHSRILVEYGEADRGRLGLCTPIERRLERRPC